MLSLINIYHYFVCKSHRRTIYAYMVIFKVLREPVVLT